MHSLLRNEQYIGQRETSNIQCRQYIVLAKQYIVSTIYFCAPLLECVSSCVNFYRNKILVSIATKPTFTIDPTTAYASFTMESMEEASTSSCGSSSSSNCSSSSSSSSSDEDVIATVVRTTAAVSASIAATTKIISGTSRSGTLNAYSDGTQVRKERRVFDHSGALHLYQERLLGS
jgi:hypothetical protein